MSNNRTATVRARLNPALKKEAEKILNQLGLTHSEAIYIFYNLIKVHQGLPFDVKIPNKETIETFRKTDRGEGLTEYDSVDEMFEDAESW